MPNISDKAATFHPHKLTNIKAKEIDYFEAVLLLNIDGNTPLRSRVILNLQAFHASFGDQPGY